MIEIILTAFFWIFPIFRSHKSYTEKMIFNMIFRRMIIWFSNRDACTILKYFKFLMFNHVHFEYAHLWVEVAVLLYYNFTINWNLQNALFVLDLCSINESLSMLGQSKFKHFSPLMDTCIGMWTKLTMGMNEYIYGRHLNLLLRIEKWSRSLAQANSNKCYTYSSARKQIHG